MRGISWTAFLALIAAVGIGFLFIAFLREDHESPETMQLADQYQSRMRSECEVGLRLNNAGKLTAAIDTWMAASEYAYPVSRLEAVAFCMLSTGLVENMGEIKEWLQTAQERGARYAAVLLAAAYGSTKVGNPDIARSEQFIESAARDGIPDGIWMRAERKLDARMHGTPTSGGAIEELQLAAENGSLPAIERLYEIYSMGLFGIDPEPATAERWRQRALSRASELNSKLVTVK